uniref:Trihelix transcription factor GT-2 isoform X2 n=2 Tax=Rhizophora mucronata TaxID=61149 RepID=A0A2P2L670_RHIMU
MDVAFREAGVKGPLWEEVSRKLGELGYHRSAKKCREKFENVYKYHKRTKEGRTSKQQGKTYRFFDQLEAFENQSSSLSSSLPAPPKPQIPANETPMANPCPILSASNITTTATLATTMPQGIATPTINLTVPAFTSANPTILPTTQATNPINPAQSNFPSSFASISMDFLSSSTSSSTSSDVELQGRHKRKRKWKDFFERLMKEVMKKQEEMQMKFLEAIEKREHERMSREESWRMQEMARINREREILAQERSIAAAKDAAVMAFLQKLSEQNAGQGQHNLPASQPPPPPPAPSPLQSVPPPPQPMPPLPQPAQATSTPSPPPVPVPLALQPVTTTNVVEPKSDNGDQNIMPTGSSRWPKVEVEALIRLRSTLDSKYKESGPKGPLWEEISAGMKRLGYNRNAKRCKEKWENINKYFKKVKESNKKRPEDSKTCPYFHQLDALYREKNRIDGPSTIQLNPENSVPLMVRPEQQWPPPPQQEQRPDSVMEDLESEDNQNPHDEDDDKDNDDEEEDEAGGYEIVASKPASMS